jgi:hypothetical protein
MKTIVKPAGLVVLGVGLIFGGCAKKKSFTSWQAVHDPVVAAQLKSFVAEKLVQVNTSTNELAPGFAPYFAAAQRGDWLAVSNQFKDLANHAPQYQHSGTNDARLTGTAWAAVAEIWGALDAFAQGNEKYSALYANDIIESIPPGSIYFGGTDEGRFVVTAMQKSQVDGDPFFTLTQNALADGSYLDYLRSMYGETIYIPSREDSQECFNEYSDDAKKRLENHQLKRGENIKVGPDGKLVISGQVAVMEINALIAKVIFDKNPKQDFYLEQSFPLDWMYPYLEPHGLIFKINREPLDELPEDVVQVDHDYWSKIVSPIIGDWLTDDTSVPEVVRFAKKVFSRGDFSGFTGDRQFVENSYARGSFSWERANIAGLYVWRMKHASSADEKERMAQEADFAFRQALALDPFVASTVNAYQNFLRSQNREADASALREMPRQVQARKT